MKVRGRRVLFLGNIRLRLGYLERALDHGRCDSDGATWRCRGVCRLALAHLRRGCRELVNCLLDDTRLFADLLVVGGVALCGQQGGLFRRILVLRAREKWLVNTRLTTGRATTYIDLPHEGGRLQHVVVE